MLIVSYMSFVSSILVKVNAIISIGNVYLNNVVSQLGDYIQKHENMSKFAMTVFNLYVDCCVFIKTNYDHLYGNSPMFRIMVNYLHYGKNYINAQVNQYKIEPYGDHWVSMHVLIKNNHIFKGSQYIHIENYLSLLDDLSPNSSYNEKVENGFMYMYNIVMSLISSFLYVIDAIVIMKDGDRYITRSILSKHDKFYHDSSKHVFLSIEYSHPKMDKPIPIEFPEEMYEIGNVVFTPMFVKRCLEYQMEHYVFDENYTINIIDCDANMVSLNNKQYGILMESGWDIVDLPKEEESKEEESKEEESKEEESERKVKVSINIKD